MDGYVIIMVLLIVGAGLGFTLLLVHWGLKHEEKKMDLKAGSGDVARLAQVLESTQAEMARLRERVQVLEKLATDDDRRLAGDIERLRAEQRV
jgi:cell division protein FtsB